MAMISSLSGCQITNNIWGCTLGQSSYAQVKVVTDKKGYHLTKMEGSSMPEIFSYYNNYPTISFGAELWQSVACSFLNGKLMHISFARKDNSGESYRAVRDRLKAKYQDYFDGETTQGNTIQTAFVDKHTLVLLSLNTDGVVLLQYFDQVLRKMQYQHMKDEL